MVHMAFILNSSAIVRAVNGLLDLGRSLGSAVRRVQNGRICSL